MAGSWTISIRTSDSAPQGEQVAAVLERLLAAQPATWRGELELSPEDPVLANAIVGGIGGPVLLAALRRAHVAEGAVHAFDADGTARAAVFLTDGQWCEVATSSPEAQRALRVGFPAARVTHV